MDLLTADLHVPFKMHLAAYNCRLKGIQTVLQFAVSQADDDCLYTGIYCGEGQLECYL